MNDLEFRTMENEIKFSFRCPAGIGRLFFRIGADQAGRSEKKFEFPLPPEQIEIPGKDHRPVHFADQAVQPFKLVLPVTVGQGKMH